MAFGGLKGTLVGAANSITNPIDATGSVVVAVGDLVFGVIGEQTSLTAGTVTDNLGNTYAATQAGTDAGTSTGRAYYSRVTVAGTLTAVHFAATASTDNVAVVAAVIEGPFVTSPLDANPTNITSDITSPFTCPATGTLAQASEVVMAWGVATGSTVWAATSPNLLATQQATQSVLHTVVGYQAVAATTTVSPAFTAASNPTDAVLGTASFKQDLSATGTAAQTITKAAQSASGKETFTGTAANTETHAAQAAAGTVANPVTGTAAQTSIKAAQAASGTETFTGTAAQAAIKAAQAASGAETFTGTAAQTIIHAAQSAAGTSGSAGATGTAAQTLGIAAQSAAGTMSVAAPGVPGGGVGYRGSVGKLTDEEWEKARKAFAKARRKRKELEAKLETPRPAKAAQKLETQVAIAREREDQAFDLMASINSIMAQAFANDAAVFYANQAKQEEELMIILALAA